MTLDKNEQFGSLNKDRHNRDFKLISGFRDQEESILKNTKEKRDREEAAYQAMAELQKLISDAKKFEEEIEIMHVELAHLAIQIKQQE